MSVGQRWPLKNHAMLVGREPDEADVLLPFAGISRRHCTLRLLVGQWHLDDLRTNNGTFLNGQRVEHRAILTHGDLIELPFDIVFRYLEREWGPDLLLGAGEAVVDLAQHPADDPRWRVWGDRLLEQQHPMGERIVRQKPASAEELGQWVGPVVREVHAGELELTWAHGFIRRAVLRNLEWSSGFRQPLLELLSEPAARFVRELEIDALSYARGLEREDMGVVQAQMVDALQALAHSVRPRPPLSSLTFGPFHQPVWSPALAAAWRAAASAYPGLDQRASPIGVARHAALALLAAPAGLLVRGLSVGARLPLSDEAVTRVGAAPGSQLCFEAVDSRFLSALGFELYREAGQWWVNASAPRLAQPAPTQMLEVNGRTVKGQRLRHGDLIEPVAGLQFRFELV